MSREEEITKVLSEAFPYIECSIARARRISVQAPRENIVEIIGFIKNDLKFGFLCTITGLDAGDDIQLIYHLASDEGIMLNVKTSAPKAEPVFETVTNIYYGATLYELEIHNLLGAAIKGIPDDIPYPLPDGWPTGQYPLRKDWKQQDVFPGPKGEK
jgi:NADH:ubiquinone oxidoreductase subunit C